MLLHQLDRSHKECLILSTLVQEGNPKEVCEGRFLVALGKAWDLRTRYPPQLQGQSTVFESSTVLSSSTTAKGQCDSVGPFNSLMQPSPLAFLSRGPGRVQGWFLFHFSLLLTLFPTFPIFLQETETTVSTSSQILHPLHLQFWPIQISLFHLEVTLYGYLHIVTKTNLCKLTGLSVPLK